jgi:sporulation protein YlmC with PRC-barrel domain
VPFDFSHGVKPIKERNMSYSKSAPTGDVGARETVSLIAASKVDGTAVYNSQGESLGHIHEVMLNKLNGKVTYAVLSFGGFLGIGEKYHPLPWEQLTYNESYGGYVVNLDKRRLEGAPSYGVSDVPDWDSPTYRGSIDGYYGNGPI